MRPKLLDIILLSCLTAAGYGWGIFEACFWILCPLKAVIYDLGCDKKMTFALPEHLYSYSYSPGYSPSWR